MKYVYYFLVLFLGLWAVKVSAEPSAACRAFIEKNCQGEHPRKCLMDNRDKLPTECKQDMEAHRGKRFHPGGMPPFFEKCKDAMPKCEGKGPGPEHFKCLEENGSAECKAALKRAREHQKEGPGF